jgi:hypothetical protein
MDIAEKKHEILKLIEQLQPGAAEGSAPQRAAPQPEPRIPSRSLSNRISRRKQELAEIRGRREQLGLTLLEERVLAICQALEQRIARIEETLAKRPPAVAAAPQQQQPSGTDIAESGLDMEPDIGQLGGLDFSTAATKTQDSSPPPTRAAGTDNGYTLSGAIEEGVLADILQFVSTNGKTGAFVVSYLGQEMSLYFREGQICHAAAGDMTGENALFAAMAAEEGRFHFDETEDIPDEVTIDGNTQFLILEALRQIDESRGGQ